MRLLIQRATRGKVTIEGDVKGEIGTGYVVLVGMKKGDTEDTVRKLADKLLNIRLMRDEAGKVDNSILDVQGEILAISQFTLYATTKGRRPGFTEAEDPERAKELFDLFLEELRKSGLNIQTGEFGADMQVALVNDGPTTILLEEG